MSSVWSDRPFLIVLAAVLAVALLLVISVAVPFGLSAYLANAIGQLAAFAVLALSLDLIWGYLGILSLGHGLFFGIGGYVIAMYLLKHSFEVTGKVSKTKMSALLKALIARVCQGRSLVGADVVGDWSKAVYGGALLAPLLKQGEALLDQPWRAPAAMSAAPGGRGGRSASSSGRAGKSSARRIRQTSPQLRRSTSIHQPGSHSPCRNPSLAEPGNA